MLLVLVVLVVVLLLLVVLLVVVVVLLMMLLLLLCMPLVQPFSVPNEKPALVSDELPRCWILGLDSLAHLQKTANRCPHCCESICELSCSLCFSGKFKASKSPFNLILQFGASKAIKLGRAFHSIGACYCLFQL